MPCAFNGLTDEFHPTQMLADVLTMIENCDKPLSEIKYVYIGDAQQPGNSLLLIGAKLGMDVHEFADQSPITGCRLVTCAKNLRNKVAPHEVTDDIDWR